MVTVHDIVLILNLPSLKSNPELNKHTLFIDSLLTDQQTHIETTDICIYEGIKIITGHQKNKFTFKVLYT